MSFLDALFTGAKAIFRGLAPVAKLAVKTVLAELNRTPVGRIGAEFVSGLTKMYFASAQSLAEEERELAEKFSRDGRRTESDKERLSEIENEREQVKQSLNEAKARQAEEDLREAQDEVISAPLTDDDASAASGILSSKKCPECSGTMRIRQGGFQNGKTRRFWWQCTAQNSFLCPTIKIDFEKEKSSILRKPDADLDGASTIRRKIWETPEMVVKTHGRLRQILGDSDEEIICPTHVLPMKLMQKYGANGKLLSSYEYVCLGVGSNGNACDHKVPVETFAQVGTILRRRDGVGIADS